MLGVVISIYYYFGWIRECYFSAPSTEMVEVANNSTSQADRILLGGMVVATLAIGFLPAVLPIIR